ncbi:MAG: TRAP transporter substrate-binding protein [Xanthobacteraceae bacterium]
MKRREFLKSAGIGLTASAVAAPAIAQSTPEIKWRLTSSFPKSLDTLWGAAETFAKYVGESTDNKFQVQTFAAGEIVPGLQAADAVSNGTVEACHTATYYYIGKDPTFALFCAVPFGLNSRQQNAWFYDGDGLKLMNDFTKKYNLYNLLAGNTGCQMGGWFRKEIKEVADLSGLKFRIGGFAGNVLAKLGVVAQQIAGGDIYPALEKGTIDAAEWVGPYDDEKLGFQRVAPFYYYPGWWEGALNLSFYVGKAKWEELPQQYKDALESACRDSTIETMAKYDVQNPQALRRLVAAGTQLRPFPREVMQACYKAAFELYDETAAKNENFRKVYEPWKAFRDSQFQWFRVAESTFDNFVYFMHAQEQQQCR